jgi:hypothetical protein
MPKGTRRSKTLFNLNLVLWHLPQTEHLAWGPPVKLAEGGNHAPGPGRHQVPLGVGAA